MKLFFGWFVSTLLLIVVWASFNVISTKQGWFLELPATANDPKAFMDFSTAQIKAKSNGNISFLLIQEGRIYDEFSTSKGRPVNKDTVFGVSSLSKWVTAVGVMTLVESGKLDLDEPVSTYLTRWQLPDTGFNNDGVTVRRLLSHTAGLTDGLGHNGFSQDQQVQPLVEHLTRALDADEGASGRVAVGIAPGTEWKYSGGSYNLLQLIIEEISGSSFESYMQTAVFVPLRMTNSGYREPLNKENLATYFNEKGEPTEYPRYTSLAATGLYTTTADMYRFVSAHVGGVDGEIIGRGILSESSLRDMRQPQASKMGLAIWGAGPMLFVDVNDDYIIGHGGLSPSLSSTARINPTTGNGIVIFQTGNHALSADIAMQWNLWEAGKPGMYILRNIIPKTIKSILIGSLTIFILSIVAVWLRKRSR